MECTLITLDQFERHEVETMMSALLSRLQQVADAKANEITSIELELNLASHRQDRHTLSGGEVDLVRHLAGLMNLLLTRDLSEREYGLIED